MTNVKNQSERIRGLLYTLILAIYLTSALVASSCTPVYDFWKKSQTFMYVAQGMYTIDTLTGDTLVTINPK